LVAIDPREGQRHAERSAEVFRSQGGSGPSPYPQLMPVERKFDVQQ
jgi:hypothetical protein